ncbi:MAG TPA: hypothetical protein VNM37_02440 [Candidatus Dormibacteraeota bacterium]|nr:hypothetical protein [Candidatus Dormibacteraeota bacterium]
MKTSTTINAIGFAFGIWICGLATATADIQVRLSVKFILNSDGSRPAVMPLEGGNEIGTQPAFEAAVRQGNQVLADTGRGYRLSVVEYVDIQPAAPSGQAADYWFNLPARSNRQTIEDAATASAASKVTWQWNANAINIYVNNSRSGQCSLVGQGGSIALGDPIFGLGTLVHEVGHVFDLRHTHPGDNNGSVAEWGNGDGLDETLPDDPDASAADIAARYPNESQQKRDDLFFNVMSYHQEERLLPVQMDLWTKNANNARAGFCSGKTWFVANGGSDGSSGDTAASPLATVSKGLSKVSSADDIILLRGGTFSAPPGRVIRTPCTLRATLGLATVR